MNINPSVALEKTLYCVVHYLFGMSKSRFAWRFFKPNSVTVLIENTLLGRRRVVKANSLSGNPAFCR